MTQEEFSKYKTIQSRSQAQVLLYDTMSGEITYVVGRADHEAKIADLEARVHASEARS